MEKQNQPSPFQKGEPANHPHGLAPLRLTIIADPATSQLTVGQCANPEVDIQLLVEAVASLMPIAQRYMEIKTEQEMLKWIIDRLSGNDNRRTNRKSPPPNGAG